mmetsp:Transcript_17927/g.55993  ORF Transcript_17927/g.55993 Transcript_17927/m.55993 type:complete len:227 (+) Transcript_17927:71-751(+)
MSLAQREILRNNAGQRCNVYDAAPRTTQKPAAWPAMIAARASPLASPSSLRSSRVLLLGSAKRISSSRSSSDACWPGGGWEDAAGCGGDPSQRPRGSRPSRAWEPSRRALSGLGGAGSSHASRSPEIARDCPRPPPAPHDSHAPLALKGGGRRRQRLEGRQRVDEEQLEEREPEQHVGELHERDRVARPQAAPCDGGVRKAVRGSLDEHVDVEEEESLQEGESCAA